MEVWKSIPNYEELYEVSSLGRVKSLPVKKSYWSLRTPKEKILNPKTGSYYSVGLIKDGVNNTIQIHQLVAMSFLGHKRCGHKLVIDHINENKLDNRLENLRIVSQKFNVSRSQGENISKYKGITYDKKSDKWMCKIMIVGEKKYLGIFKTKKEAIEVYKAYENYRSKKNKLKTL
jgi:hypothetical protein